MLQAAQDGTQKCYHARSIIRVVQPGLREKHYTLSADAPYPHWVLSHTRGTVGKQCQSSESQPQKQASHTDCCVGHSSENSNSVTKKDAYDTSVPYSTVEFRSFGNFEKDPHPTSHRIIYVSPRNPCISTGDVFPPPTTQPRRGVRN